MGTVRDAAIAALKETTITLDTTGKNDRQFNTPTATIEAGSPAERDNAMDAFNVLVGQNPNYTVSKDRGSNTLNIRGENYMERNAITNTDNSIQDLAAKLNDAGIPFETTAANTMAAKPRVR